MYRINPKPWVDRTTPTNLTKNYDIHHWAHLKGSSILNQPQKRPYTDSLSSDSKGTKDSFEHSPVPKARVRQEAPTLNPTYRSANFSKQTPTEAPRVTHSYRNEKSMKTDHSLQEIPHLTKESTLPYYEPTKCSSNRNGIIKAYAANTNQGIVREYNEDRVSIILNIVKPQSRSCPTYCNLRVGTETWPKCSFFGVYDGHGGAACADFLRDNLHQFVIREPDFPWNPYEALRKGFEAAEKSFIELALSSYAKGQAERSGSCAIVSLIVGDTCYIGNVGDSRAVMSAQKGKQVYTLSRDHKPCDELEQQRIQAGGGKIYQYFLHDIQKEPKPVQVQRKISRVLPGRLSVSRTFGDIEAKLAQFGGNPKVVVAEPEIRSFKIQPEHDFIVLASDGIFDKMSSGDVLRTIWDDLGSSPQQTNLHAQVSGAVEAVLKESINRRTYDNITVVMIAFQKEDERPKTVGSVEREQHTSSISPTPVAKAPSTVFQGASHRDEKTYLRSSAQQAKALVSYNKPLRSSLEQIDYNKKTSQHPAQQHPLFQYVKQDHNKSKYGDENQENYAFAGNKMKEMKQSSHHMELKMSNDFRKVNQLKRPLQLHDFGNRYQGRIF